MNKNVGFTIPLFDDNKKIVGEQAVGVSTYKGNFEFTQQGTSEPIITITAGENKNTQSIKKEIVFDNKNHEFDDISKDEVIKIELSSISMDYTGDLTFVSQSKLGNLTFKITSNAVLLKKDNEKTFSQLKTFSKPLDVNLPKDLKQIIEKGMIDVTSLPAQMYTLLKDTYKFDSFETKDEKLKILKTQSKECWIINGNKLIKSTGLSYVKNGQFSVVGVTIPSASGVANRKSTKGLGFYVTEEELKQISSFIEGRELANKEFLKPKDMHNFVDFKRPQTAKVSTKQFLNGNSEETKDNDNGDNINPNSSGKDDDPSPETGDESTNEVPPKKDTDSDDDNDDGDLGSGSNNLKPEDTPKQNNPNDDGSGTDNSKKDDNSTGEHKENSDKKDNDKKAADDAKKSDDKTKKEQKQAASKAFNKGLRLILYVAAANFFLAGFMLANPIYGLLCLLCLFGSLSSYVTEGSSGSITSLFTFPKDIYDYVKAKNNIKELTARQQKTLHKLQRKLENGKTLSKKEQKKLDYLTARQENHWSKSEWKEAQRTNLGEVHDVHVEPFSYTEDELLHQDQSVYTDDQEQVEVFDEVNSNVKEETTNNDKTEEQQKTVDENLNNQETFEENKEEENKEEQNRQNAEKQNKENAEKKTPSKDAGRDL